MTLSEAAWDAGNTDVYATCEGSMLRKDDGLGSCGVRDGSTVQAVSMMRGGGKHKDNKGKAEKKQAASTNRLDQKCAGEPKSDQGPAIRECDKDAVIRMIEERKEFRDIVERVSDGSDVEVDLTKAQEFLGFDTGQRVTVECGIWWTVESRRKGRGR